MKVGDLVSFKDPCYLSTADLYDEERARQLYPWKFEVGIVVDDNPGPDFPGKEVYVHYPGSRLRSVLMQQLEIVND